MLRIVKGTLRRLRRYRIAQAPKRITELRRRVVRLTGALQGKDEAHQFLGGVGDGDIVMLAFSPLFCQISGEGSIPMADVLCGVVERVAKVTGAAFLHVRIGVIQLARLVSGRGKACIGEDLIRGIEAGEIADFSEDHKTWHFISQSQLYKRSRNDDKRSEKGADTCGRISRSQGKRTYFSQQQDHALLQDCSLGEGNVL